jgi:glycerol-3-phosphate dehydrogenase (NAD(P)+)
MVEEAKRREAKIMNITVIGTGAWGSAAAAVSARRGHTTRIWGRNPVSIPQVKFCADISEALSKAEMVLLGIPSHAMREVCIQAKPSLYPQAVLVSLAKGIEQGSDLRMSEIIRETTGRNEIVVLSGPSFASEVMKGMPTALVVASKEIAHAKKVQDAFNGEDFRVYTHTDIVGVELGGSLKNVIAIAAGACVGMKLGENTLAALITRGLAELSRVGVALGGQPQTFYGLSGVGDLILTCSSHQSRNRQVGEGLGAGSTLPEILSKLKGTAEGVKTSESLFEIFQAKNIDAPIMQEIYLTLHQNKPVKQALRDLMSREPKAEFK